MFKKKNISRFLCIKTNKILQFVFILFIIAQFPFVSVAQESTHDKFLVVLDPGHGGHDPGNIGNGYKEKNIALKIVLDIGKELEKNPNIKVIYTRKKDVFVTLRGRAKIANDADADLFVSVHCNAHSSQANGTETFVLGLHANQRNFEVAKKENEVIYLEEDYKLHYEGFDPNSPESLIGLTLVQEDYLDQSIRLASNIETNFNKKLKRKSRGVKQAGFWVLHNTYMPSVLIETGFLTYKKEGAYLNSSKGQNHMAKAISDAVLEYIKVLDSNIGERIFTSNSKPTKTEVTYQDVVFKVQIAASSRKLETKSYNFKGLSNISRVQSGNIYKYYYGEVSNYNQAKQLQANAKKKGYSSSFIVAYKNGERISLKDVLKTP